jgi:hypothetical protein
LSGSRAATQAHLREVFTTLGLDADYVGYPRLARAVRDALDLGVALGLPVPT